MCHALKLKRGIRFSRNCNGSFKALYSTMEPAQTRSSSWKGAHKCKLDDEKDKIDFPRVSGRPADRRWPQSAWTG